MPSRDVSVAVRLTDREYSAIERAAQCRGLKLGEWLRLSVQATLTAEDGLYPEIVRHVMAVRMMLINVLLFLSPSNDPQKGISSRRLSELSQIVDTRAQQLIQPLLTRTPTAEDETKPPVRCKQVGTRLADHQYEAVLRAAQQRTLPPTIWLRETALARIHDDTLVRVIHKQVLGLRLIIDEAVRRLTTEGQVLDRDLLQQLANATDPATLYTLVGSTETPAAKLEN